MSITKLFKTDAVHLDIYNIHYYLVRYNLSKQKCTGPVHSGLIRMSRSHKLNILNTGSICKLSILLVLHAVSCGLFQKTAPGFAGDGNIRSITKSFPDGSTYIMLYDFPPSAAQLIPVYLNARLAKMYVYGDSNMDMVFETRSGIAEVQDSILNLVKEKGWTLERSGAYPEAEHGLVSVPLKYNGYTVDTIEIPAAGGRVAAAHSKGVVSVYRMVTNRNSGMTIIIQQLRVSK